MNFHYHWWYTDNLNSRCESFDAARGELKRYLPWIEKAYDAVGAQIEPNDTVYFYESEEDMNADQDGAWTPSITTVIGQDCKRGKCI